MAVNLGVFSGRTGMLRIVTLVLGVIALGIASAKYWRYGREEFFLAMVIIMFIISVIFCIIYVTEAVAISDNLKKGDMLYHLIGGLLLLISAIVWLVSVFDIGNDCFFGHCPTGHYILRIFAGFIGIINGVVYGLLGYTLYQGGASTACI